MRLLLVGPGMGGGKVEYLRGRGLHDVVVADLPEPTAGDDEAMAAGTATLVATIHAAASSGCPFDVVVASSRGGRYAASLICTGGWAGPTCLISAFSTDACCSQPWVPVLVIHGSRDGTNPISRVREDVARSPTGSCVLVELDSDHSLGLLVKEDRLEGLLTQCRSMAAADEDKKRKLGRGSVLDSRALPAGSSAHGTRTVAPPSRQALFAQITRRSDGERKARSGAAVAPTPECCGVNYEGGKITAHARSSPLCIGATNIQVAMDAPFAGEVADEETRSKGRSEAQFSGYDEALLKRGLEDVLSVVARVAREYGGREHGAPVLPSTSEPADAAAGVRGRMVETRADDAGGGGGGGGDGRDGGADVVLQIARGRSAQSFFRDVVAPILQQCGTPRAPEVYQGYRSTTFFPLATTTCATACTTASTVTQEEEEEAARPRIQPRTRPFVFVNIGMFARLTGDLLPGAVCIPTLTVDVDVDVAAEDGGETGAGGAGRGAGEMSAPTPRRLVARTARRHPEDLGLRVGGRITRITLLGIADHMPFVTPENYAWQDFAGLVARWHHSVDASTAPRTTSMT